MSRTRFGPVRETLDEGANLRGSAYSNLPMGEIEVVDLTPAMHVGLTRDKLPAGAGMEVKNGRTRHNWVGRRPGTYEPIEQPDNDIVLKVFTVYLDQDRRWLVRVTRNNIHATRSLDGWHQFTGTPVGYDLKIDATQFQENLYIASQAKRLIRVDFRSQSYKEVATAPKALFVTSFADRLVCANVLDPFSGWTGTRLQWSANGFPEIWDDLEDESAGFVNLDSAPSDYGDEITGLFPVGGSLLVLRERSVWIAERQPIASDPFRFTPLVLGIGCDLPHTGAVVPGGVMWADRKTRAVYYWAPGRLPERVSGAITTELFEDIDETSWIEGAYDPYEHEYHLGLNVPKLLVDYHCQFVDTRFLTKTWVWNLDTRGWCYDVGPIASTIGHVVGVDDLVYIDELTGVIDAQVADSGDDLKPNPSGWIDDWGYDPEDTFQPALYKGTPTGEVITYSWNAQHDFDCARFEFLWQSQNMGHPVNQRTLSDLRVRASALQHGYSIIEYSKDDVLWKQQKTLRPHALERVERHGCGRVFSGADLWWRVRSDSPGFRMYEFWARMLEKSRHRAG
jgi:hypothetical protein